MPNSGVEKAIKTVQKYKKVIIDIAVRPILFISSTQ